MADLDHQDPKVIDLAKARSQQKTVAKAKLQKKIEPKKNLGSPKAVTGSQPKWVVFLQFGAFLFLVALLMRTCAPQF